MRSFTSLFVIFLPYSDIHKSFTSIPTFYITDYLRYNLYFKRFLTSPVTMKNPVSWDFMYCNLAETYQLFSGWYLLSSSSGQKMETVETFRNVGKFLPVSTAPHLRRECCLLSVSYILYFHSRFLLHVWCKDIRTAFML
jgi:hypothetical protein